MRSDPAEAAILTLLRARAPDATICPSEAARTLAKARGAPEDWRADMNRAHDAARRLAEEGAVTLRQGGEVVETPKGAYRIGRVGET